MNATLTLSMWTFRETLRDRILWAYGVFGLLLVLGLYSVGRVPWGETHLIVGQLGYSAIAFVSQLLVALIAAFQLGRDVERRVHYMILGRDIDRSSYLLGRFLGLLATASLLAAALMTLLFVLNTIQAPYREPLWSLFLGLPAIILQMAMILAVAMLLYQLTTSSTLAVILAFLALVIGRSVASVQELLAPFGDAPRMIGRTAAYLFPNLELLTFNEVVIHEQVPDWASVAAASLYGVSYLVAALAFSIWLFNRKEL
jgi:Cu-processing system permease protein